MDPENKIFILMKKISRKQNNLLKKNNQMQKIELFDSNQDPLILDVQ